MKHLSRLILIAILATALITACTKDEDEDTPANIAPVASFTLTPENGSTQTVFNLDATACTDAETPADQLQVRWDANDDGIWESDYSTDKLATLTYDQAGTYTIRLEVLDGGGATASATKEVLVSGNSAPEAPGNPFPADGSLEINPGESLEWACSDPEQDPLSYDLYFGTVLPPPLVESGLTSSNYSPAGMLSSTTYYWKVTAHDDQGNTTEGPTWSFQTAFVCGDVITDPRNGETYPTVQIGDQCWMAKNLNIGERLAGSSDMSDNGTIEKYCYDDEEANCETYGGLYQWEEIVQYSAAEDICPAGWHVPSLEEWQQLEMDLGMTEAEATASTGWQGSNGEGNMLKEGGSSGFNALMSGHRRTTGGFLLGEFGTAFWTATQASTYIATARSLDTDHNQVNHTNYDKKYGHAVRCIKNQY